ncbi:MAG: CvpA family protein [Anaerolineales bacterium]
MTILDVLLIIIGLSILILSAMQGLIRSLVMIFGFYMTTLAAGFLTLGTDIIQNLMRGITEILEAPLPHLQMSQTFVFLGVGVPMFIVLYFVSKMAFEDTMIKELGGFDNVFGLLAGGVLAILVMAVLCNTWGVIVSRQWQPTETWQSMRVAYQASQLKPFLHQILLIYDRLLFQFRFTGYPPFFIPQ